MAVAPQSILCLFTILNQIVQTSATCGPICRAPFVEIGRGKCFFDSGTAPNISEAHYKCYLTKSNYGLHSVLIATDLDKAIQVLPASNSTIKYAWTGINDYLLEQNGDRIGWRAVNAELKDVVIDEKDEKWAYEEPTHGGTLMLQTDGSSYKLHTSYLFPKQSEGHVICQLIREATVKLHSESFRMTKFSSTHPVRLNEYSGQAEESIWVFSPSVSLLQCAFRCKKVLECRSIYFNTMGKTCVLVMFADTKLPNKLPGRGWIRMGRIF
ncbi:hypothetical protein FGIG_00001 [Fasciola gigantica]|uniref:Apple domain-containing protein n=1 Tax=Fasciola gigantica TaxID=46835 RepID=A0A504YNQ3_FASGI|nr:hypothetical protein FGIG_00001 [Fasciola gigantica]